MLLLQDLLYDARADTNVVSLLKLHEAGLYGNITAAEVNIYNMADPEPIVRASKHDNVYCLEDLALPPRSTDCPSRNISDSTEQANSILTTGSGTTSNQTKAISHRGLIGLIFSGWGWGARIETTLVPTPITTTYPPFRLPSDSATITPIELSRATSYETAPTVASKPAPSPSPDATL